MSLTTHIHSLVSQLTHMNPILSMFWANSMTGITLVNGNTLSRQPSLFPPRTNGAGMKPQKGYLPSDKKKRYRKDKKAIIKSYTDIQTMKVGKIFTGKSKNTRLNQPAQKGSRVRYTPVSHQ